MALIFFYKVIRAIWGKLSSVICIKENIVVVFMYGMYGQLFDPHMVSCSLGCLNKVVAYCGF